MTIFSNRSHNLHGRSEDNLSSNRNLGTYHLGERNYIELKIVDILRNKLELDVTGDIDILEKPLENLGLNSISYIRLLVAIESEFNLEVDDKVLDAYFHPTIRSLALIIEKSFNKRK